MNFFLWFLHIENYTQKWHNNLAFLYGFLIARTPLVCVCVCLLVQINFQQNVIYMWELHNNVYDTRNILAYFYTEIWPKIVLLSDDTCTWASSSCMLTLYIWLKSIVNHYGRKTLAAVIFSFLVLFFLLFSHPSPM